MVILGIKADPTTSESALAFKINHGVKSNKEIKVKEDIYMFEGNLNHPNP